MGLAPSATRPQISTFKCLNIISPVFLPPSAILQDRPDLPADTYTTISLKRNLRSEAGNLRSVMVVLAVAAGVGRGGFVIEWPVKWE